MGKPMKYPNIEAERARNGMTVEELALELNICRKTYYNWVNNGKIPQRAIEKMANIFRVSADYLLAG